MIVIHLLSTVGDVIVTDDCSIVEVVVLVVMESSNSKFINSILQVIHSLLAKTIMDSFNNNRMKEHIIINDKIMTAAITNVTEDLITSY